ncbi:MAG: FAD:protein FMN transferase [Pseudomonadota bacterium]
MPTVGWLELHLGTRVEIACRAEQRNAGEAAVQAAFAEIQNIHQLMSFHLPDSDVSRLNRRAAREVVTVDPRTVKVVRAACELSRQSQGYFDCTTAAELVSDGHLPRPASSDPPDPDASWRDIEILTDDTVSFRRPLWLDLGGIAKGYAVDRALHRCLASEVKACLVNAGGDCRVSDTLTASVTLDVPGQRNDQAATIQLSGGSLASSCTGSGGEIRESAKAGPHYDGRWRRPLSNTIFASVLSEDCMIADALTKVVLCLGDAAAPILARWRATAFLFNADSGWRQLPASRSAWRKAHG